MKTVSKPYNLIYILSLLLLCSCATARRPSDEMAASELPPAVTLNNDAGRGNWLIVTLNLENGEELPVLLDTGAATFLDESLAPRLGKPIATAPANGAKHEAYCYPAPKLFLGNIQLRTGDTVRLRDFTRESSYAGRRVMGVLGIDCLKHYCIQLDFEAGKIRFLDPNHLEITTLGQAFPLTVSGDWQLPLLQNGGLVEGGGKYALIDSGYDADGTLNAEQFALALRKGELISINDQWARLPNCVWNGEKHTNLLIGRFDKDVIGLKFLARHLVTLNFPKRTMYLKQTRNTPLPKP